MRHRRLHYPSFGIATLLFVGLTPGALHAQTLQIGRTQLFLGMSWAQAVGSLRSEFELRAEPGNSVQYTILSRDSTGDSLYHFRGQIRERNGHVTTIVKVLSPDRETAVSEGEAFFLMLESLAVQNSLCRVTASRQGIVDGPGAGSTMLNAAITCPKLSGYLTIVQGSSPEVNKTPSMSLILTEAK